MDLADVIIARSRFDQMSVLNQRQWLLDYIWQHANKSKREPNVKYVIQGYEICKVAWFAVCGIGEKRFQSILRFYGEGIVHFETSRTISSKTSNLSHRSAVAKAWMTVTFQRTGDKMPDSLAIHLPSYLDRRMLYRYLTTDLNQQEERIISYSQFCYLMSTEFPDVRIPQVNRLTKCDVCTVLKEEKQKTMDKVLRDYYDNLIEYHIVLQREERDKYYKHREKARNADISKKYMCVIIDGMDQSKLLVPALIRTAKSYSSAWRLKTHLTGVLNHGRETLAFVDVQQWPHDSNFTMNVVLQLLARMDEIPDVLYLQMDNCWRENKNQFVISFLAVLVKLGIFRKVKMNFLMSGHSHEDVDQFFSCVRRHMFKQNVRHVDELLKAVRESFTPAPHVDLLRKMFNVRQWMAPVRMELHNISNPHCFVIRKANNGDVVIKYKNWSRDKAWQPSNVLDEGLTILKSDSIIPTEVPEFVQPSSEKIDMNRLKAEVPRFFKSRVFDDAHKQWWNDFFVDKNGLFSSQEDKPETWLLQEIMIIKQRQQHQARTVTNVDSSILGIPRPANVPKDVEDVAAVQEHEIPQMYSGRYRHPNSLCQAVDHVDNPLSALEEGVLVAVYLEDTTKLPVIVKVTSVNEDSVCVQYLKGSWRTSWEPWLLRTGEIWTDTLPKTCIILVDFKLKKNNKLSAETNKFLKDKYLELSNTTVL